MKSVVVDNDRMYRITAMIDKLNEIVRLIDEVSLGNKLNYFQGTIFANMVSKSV